MPTGFMHPYRRTSAPPSVRILAYMGGSRLLAIAARASCTCRSAARIAPAPRPEWINVERPHPAFELLMPELAAGGSDYAILRRTADGARKDVLSFGEAGRIGPYAMVEIYRPGAGSERFIDAPSEIAARILPASPSPTRQTGRQHRQQIRLRALVDFAIAVRAASRIRAKIRALPSRAGASALPVRSTTPVMQIAGWYCSAGDEIVDRATLACALDRLTILAAGGDPKLAGLFARAEIERTFCGQRSPILAATPERARISTAPRGAKLARGIQLRGRLPQR